ncbi:MAG: TlpA family protein disulfide reductase [Clostridiales bacterium]|nr:TlpA family protein disulfide reductase [Clostridiales bacterium]
MKLFKKLALLTASALLCVGLGVAAAACGEDPQPEPTPSPSTVIPPEPTDYSYCVRVANAGGFGFKGVTVKLMDGEEVVAQDTTPKSGRVYFTDIAADEYEVVLENLPNGYIPARSYKTIALEGTQVEAEITPIGVLDGEAPANTRYELGSVMYDFTVRTSDNTEYTLSDILGEKELLVINFWATWCGPCKQEFPALNNAIIEYGEDVECLAISTTDDNASVAAYKNSSGLLLNMAKAGEGNLATLFGAGGSIPQTIMIDRYGVVVFNHVGSMTSKSDWTVRFDKFLGDDYQPYVWEKAKELPGPGDGENPNPGNELVKPNVATPSASALKSAFDEAGDFSFRWQEKGVEEGDEDYDEYNWPWLIKEDADGKYIQASNQKINNSWALFFADFNAAEGDVIAFEYMIGAEQQVTGGDFFCLLLDGVKVKQISGYHLDGWTTCYAYVFKDYEAGEHTLTFAFQKDGSDASHDDIVCLRNLRVLDIDDIPASAGTDAHVYRDAANVLNTEENATAQFKEYADVVYNEKDGYYHVGTEDGPLLLVNVWYASKWCSATSLWMLAYNGYCVANGFNLSEAVEQIAWAANQPTGRLWGYATVTQEIKEILQMITMNVTEYQNWNGPSHDKEWLELCCYYENYADEAFEDPMRGITFEGAIKMHEGNNTVEVLFEMKPRGFKYKFTPTESAVYHVYSTGTLDTMCWLANENQELIGEFAYKTFNSTQIIDGVEYPDLNFEFYWYMEANTTYYLLCTTYDDKAAVYNVTIENKGETVQQFTPMATSYSQNMSSGTLFVKDAMDYMYSEEDGYYHVKNADGSMGSVIYLATHYTTYLDSNYSLTYILESMRVDDESAEYYPWDRPVEERIFYVNGTDYTDLIDTYVYMAGQVSGELYGFTPLTQELFKAIDNVVRYSAHYDGIANSWQMMCFYYKDFSYRA